MGEEDRRRWARIEASLECTVASADQAFEALAVNVSRNGLAVVAGAGLCKVGETVSVMLERAEREISLSLSGEVAHVSGSGAQTVYGIHFEALPPESELELVRLLKILSEGKGGGRREHPRVAARIAVKCKSLESFGGLLKDLSRGGMSIRCPREVKAGAILVVEFTLADQTQLISIEGTVTHVADQGGGKFLAGLRFSPPTDAERDQVQQTLDLLMGLNTLADSLD